MRIPNPILSAIACCSAFLVIALPSWGNSVHVPARSGSGYGQSQSFTDCLNGTYTDADNNCEAFNSSPLTMVTIDGNSYPVYQLVGGTNAVGNTVELFDVIDFGAVSQNFSFTLPSAYFDPTITNILECDTMDSATGIFSSSSSTPISTVCTSDATPMLTLDTSTDTFTTGNSISDLVLFSLAPVPAPEPSTITFLGAMLIPFVYFSRRRYSNWRHDSR